MFFLLSQNDPFRLLKNTPECFYNKEQESQKDKQDKDLSKKANKNMTTVRPSNNSYYLKGEKNEKFIFFIGDSMIKHLN